MSVFLRKSVNFVTILNLNKNKVKIVAHNVNEKLPQECTNIAEVRHEIDNIDSEIISLLAARMEYVREVVKYKDGTAKGIEASERRKAVIKTRGEWAEQKGISASVVESVYNTLIDYYIEEEKKLI